MTMTNALTSMMMMIARDFISTQSLAGLDHDLPLTCPYCRYLRVYIRVSQEIFLFLFITSGLEILYFVGDLGASERPSLGLRFFIAS